MANYALTHCGLLDGNSFVLQEDMTVLVKDGIIEAVDKASKLEECISQKAQDASSAYELIDLKGKFLMPGLINAHVHLFGSGKPSKALSGGKSQERLKALLKTRIGKKVLNKMVVDHAVEALHSGVTTVRGVGDIFYSDIEARERIDQGKVIGPRLLVSGQAISVTGGHGAGSFAFISDSPWEARKYVRQNVSKQVDLIKICVTGGVLDSRIIGQAGRLEMTLEEIEAICEEAHKMNFLVAAHAESIEGVRLALKGGVDTIEHGSEFDDEIIDLFLNNPKSLRGYSALIPTLYPAVTICKIDPAITLMTPVNLANGNLILDGMINGLKKASQAGVLIGLGTDASCPFVTQYNTWRELEYEVKMADFNLEEVLKNATLNNAKIMGIDHQTGSIEVGKSADILMLDSNPLKSYDPFKAVAGVMCGQHYIASPQLKKNQAIEDLLDQIQI